MSYWSIPCEAALAIALEHAFNPSVTHSNELALHVQAKVWRTCLRSCHNMITLGLAIVMAGTGELELLMQLRLAHGNITEITGYGTYMENHLALELLLLGGEIHGQPLQPSSGLLGELINGVRSE
ncbi:hypothetical protein KEM48_002448 [Puccinia striiformis f. sp. tritici PST-130]|nr:hypothetical protein KEM48_002448 [Puccinia striiformis f. sp. tritici PST-130]